MPPRWGCVSVIVWITDFTEDADFAERKRFLGVWGFLNAQGVAPLGLRGGGEPVFYKHAAPLGLCYMRYRPAGA